MIDGGWQEITTISVLTSKGIKSLDKVFIILQGLEREY